MILFEVNAASKLVISDVKENRRWGGLLAEAMIGRVLLILYPLKA